MPASAVKNRAMAKSATRAMTSAVHDRDAENEIRREPEYPRRVLRKGHVLREKLHDVPVRLEQARRRASLEPALNHFHPARENGGQNEEYGNLRYF
jgi:hypothetical protein